MDLSDIPSNQIGKLASMVKYNVDIFEITPNTYNAIIIENVRCSMLQMCNMALTVPHTLALVKAMRDWVQEVSLGDGVTLDIDTLCQYNAQGRCWKLNVENDRYGERLMRWAEDAAWSVTRKVNSRLLIERNGK